ICQSSAVADVGSGVGEEPLHALDALSGMKRRLGLGVIAGGKAVDLLAVENTVALQERHFIFQVFAAIAGFAPGEAAGVDDKRSLRAAAHLAAEFSRLPVGHP